MKILGLDPGGTTGWGKIELIGSPRPEILLRDFGEVKNEEDLESEIADCDLVVAEFFRIRPGHQDKFIFKDLHASEAIGAIRLLCRKLGVRLEMQGSDKKPMGYGFLGMKYQKGKSGKGIHQQDALAHAAYYAVKNLHARPLARKTN